MTDDTDESLPEPSKIIDQHDGVNTMAAMCRGTPYLSYYIVRADAVCPNCGSGEVYQPGQTMDLPRILKCLRCGKVDASEVFSNGR